MNITAIEDALYAWATGVTAWPAVFAEQNAPRPGDGFQDTKPYVTIRLGTSARIAQDFVDVPDAATLDQAIIGNREFVVMIQTYGPGARQTAENLRSSFSKPSVQAAFRAASLVYVDSENVENITELLVSEYEERAILDFTIRTAEELTDEPGVIETVNGQGTIKDPTGATVLTPDFTVTIP